jgi:cellulose synthase operon protein C
MFEARQVQLAKVITGATVLSLAAALTTGCNRDPNVRKQKYLESGKRYEASGKYKEAAIQIQNALKLDKNYADGNFEMAKVYLKLNNPMAAYAELARTVQLAPGNQEARITLGQLLLAGRAVDPAAQQAKAVLAVNPKNADAYALLAGVAQHNGNNAEALEDMQHAIALEPNKAAFHSALALLQASSPNTQQDAAQELQKAISLDPKDATPRILLAGLLNKKGDVAGAKQQLEAAIAAAPQNIQARSALATVYIQANEKDKAEQTLIQGVEANTDDVNPSTLLASFYAQNGGVDRAVSAFADLHSKHPKSFGVQLTYARLLYDKKDFVKATEIVSELSKKDPQNADVETLNARLLLNTGKTDDAFTLLKKAAKENPESVQTQILLADVAATKGDAATSESAYRAVNKLDPANVRAATGLADIAVHKNDPSMLQDVAERTIKLHPEFGGGYLWRGTAEGGRKEFDKAAADFQTALDKDPNNSLAYLELGQVRVAQGHAAEGQTMVQKALDKDPNSTQALATLVYFDMQAKQPAKAIARVQAQIAKSPNNAAFYVELAHLQYETKDYKNSLESARKAMQLNPGSAQPVQWFVQDEVALGDTDSALSTWQTWINAHPNDTHGYELLGSLQEAKGNIPAATDAYKKALQLDANDAAAANNLAYIMVEGGQNVDVAMNLAQTARRNAPNSPQTADTLAWVYYAKQSYSASRDLLETAAKDAPDDASIQYHLGMTYWKLNDKANAELHLKKAQSLAPNGKAGKDATDALGKLK